MGSEIKLGYTSNIDELNNSLASTYIKPSFYFINPWEIGDNKVLLFNGNVFLEKFFSDSTKDFLDWDLFLKLKINMDNNGLIFNIGSEGKINKKENNVYDNYSFYFNPQYFFETDSFVFYFNPKIGVINYPNDIYDNEYFSIGFKSIWDLNWEFIITFEGYYTKEYFSEYYIFKTPTTYTSDKMYSKILGVKLAINYFIFSSLELIGKIEFSKTDSNGNYLYYGPNEYYLILDGDESIIYNYFSNLIYGFNIQAEYNFSSGRIKPSFSYRYEKYPDRYPLDENDIIKTGESFYRKILTFSLNSKIFLSNSINLENNITWTKKSSNEYLEDVSYYDISIGFDIVF